MSLGEAAATLKTGAEKPGPPYRADRARQPSAFEPETKQTDPARDAHDDSASSWFTGRQTVLILSLSAVVLAQTAAIVLFTAQLRSERIRQAVAGTAMVAPSDAGAQAGVSGQEPSSKGVTDAAAIGSRPENPRESQLLVRTQPAGANVYVDGRRQGQSPLSLSGLVAGDHVVRVETAGASVEQAVTLVPGANAVLIAAGTSRTSGWLDVRAPADVQILERGRPVGKSSDGPLTMSPGSHSLVLRNEELGYSQEVRVTIPAGDIARIRPSFPDGVLQINAQPWASVWVDGTPVGDTPLGNLRVRLGNHEIRLRHPDLGDRILNVTVSAQAPNRVSVDLRK